MTREEQRTERALAAAEHEWLIARGWEPVPGERYRHRFQPKARSDYNRRDAMTLTRAEPLLFKKAFVMRAF